jgi:ADP-dependent phosphofructokinase/glucokinase
LVQVVQLELLQVPAEATLFLTQSHLQAVAVEEQVLTMVLTAVQVVVVLTTELAELVHLVKATQVAVELKAVEVVAVQEASVSLAT